MDDCQKAVYAFQGRSSFQKSLKAYLFHHFAFHSLLGMVFRFFVFFILTVSLPPFFLRYPHVNGDAVLIHKACQNTEYYDLCLSSLRTDPNSTRADAKGLARIVIGVAAANATATSSSLSSMVAGIANNPGMAKLLKECADKYSLASDALQAAAWDIMMESRDYAYVHVMAAQDYPNTCHNSFRRDTGSTYPPELALREDGLERLCGVILGVIDFLGY